jgi:hypothetical protein
MSRSIRRAPTLSPQARPTACPKCWETLMVVLGESGTVRRQCAPCGVDLLDSLAAKPTERSSYTRVIQERWQRNLDAYLSWEGTDILTFLEEQSVSTG